MTHLKIEQSTTQQEIVPDDTITNLAALTKANSLDASSDLAGNIRSAYAYGDDITLLNETWPNLTASCGTEYIRFKDPVVEAQIKEHLGLNRGLTEADLASIKLMSTGNTTCILNSDEIEYFDEYKYFTGVNGHSGPADAGIDDIYYGFAQVPNLKRLTFPKLNRTLTMQLASYLFNKNTPKLEYVDWNGNYAMTIPANLYAGCKSLKYNPNIIALGATIAGSNLFERCNSLEKMIFYEGFTHFYGYMFYECYSLEYVEYPSTAQFFNLKMTFKDVPNPVVVVKAAMPPTVDDATYVGNYILYVPDGSVDAYKAADGWKENASNIHPLSELPQKYRDMGTVTDEDVNRVAES